MKHSRRSYAYFADVQTARPAASRELVEDQDAVAIEFPATLRRRAVELVPGAENVTPALGHAGKARPMAGRWTIGNHELNVRVRPIGRAVVTALPIPYDGPYDLDVLLRHRLLRETGGCEGLS